MTLTWFGVERKSDGIYFHDIGCGCCSYSPTYKGEEAKDELQRFKDELADMLVHVTKLLEEQ